MGWQNVLTMAHLSYLYTTQAGASNLIKLALRKSLTDYADVLKGRSATDGYSVSIQPSEYYWGSNSGVLNNAILLILAYGVANDGSYLNTALSQFNYILGSNAHNLSFLTGIGARHVLHPHHRPSAADGIFEPVPGLLAGGPEKGRSDPVLQAKFSSSTPPALIYTDEEGSYASNEIAINWNAPLVFVAGYFASEGKSSGVGSLIEPVPGHFQLEQNFPNPFNPVTSIRYRVGTHGQVSLSVFDLLGKKITTLVEEIQSPGSYCVLFDGNELPSGTYIYNMTAGAVRESRKMTLIK
jgi:endoglucanase